MIDELDRDDVKAGLAAGTIILIDVREPHEFAAGHIPGAVLMPLSRFDPHALPDGGGKRLVLACAAGVRSLQAALRAREAGVIVDAHYRGGFKDWLAAGEAIDFG